MNPFEMVVIIVAITAIASIYRAKHGIRRDRRGNEYQVDNAENERLRHEVKELKERLAVLERITVEKENSLAREIEQLRDR
ncbi:MAG TPA: hypothetical protein VGD10_11785 [Allosphingosinicella sp.]|uniref:hypothetical protein n=1 Tax=Allosphingosinicella sp. TaxID=2823234 RepID=UPI002ED94EE1